MIYFHCSLQRSGSRIVNDLLGFSAQLNVKDNELPHYVNNVYRFVLLDVITFGFFRKKISSFIIIDQELKSTNTVVKCNNFIQIYLAMIISNKISSKMFFTTCNLRFYLNSGKTRKKCFIPLIFQYYLFYILRQKHTIYKTINILSNPVNFLKNFHSDFLFLDFSLLKLSKVKNKYRRNNGKKILSFPNYKFGDLVPISIDDYKDMFIDIDHIKKKSNSSLF